MQTSQREPVNEKKRRVISEARRILAGNKYTSDELKRLYRELEEMDQFAYASDVLLTKMEMDKAAGKTNPKEFQTLAKFIYKDHSLPSSFKFDRAIKELNASDALSKTDKCETLGLAGAIYKRIWQFDHQFKNLILSRYYYRKGFELWRNYVTNNQITSDADQNDKGYTAINYAYINELMAVDKLEEHGIVTGVSESIAERLIESERVRQYILEQLTLDSFTNASQIKPSIVDKWLPATVAEAYFGLRKYDLALKFIKEYIFVNRSKVAKDQDKEAKMEADDFLAWEIRSFSQQLFSIAYLQVVQKTFSEKNSSASAAAQTLSAIAKEIDLEKMNLCLSALSTSGSDETPPAEFEIKKDGRLGLALSGGGFRASLFHIGVLASLAEADRLKDVEVISCVSGGSIIGAYYYLKLKNLLEAKTDRQIVKSDYIKLVQEIETGFLKAVQKNLRMQIFTNIGANFRMLFDRNYSRTHRLGELYEKYFYSELLPGLGRPVYMDDLFINPKVDNDSFDIRLDNWKRKNKVPQLVLNATSVNTGHNWQFTASWMGEPPGNIQADIDVKPRLRRMYYDDAPQRYKKFRLGYAVGASSCVPVMFHPMPMYDLYDGIDLQLIDGGLHDNQGIAALIEQECRNMIISDASGQMPTNKIATGNAASIFYRADNILQERLRELQFMDIKERNYTTQIYQLHKIHLKNGLQDNPKSWKDCTDPPRKIVNADLVNRDTQLLDFGVLRKIQVLLSEIRTDLDSFHDLEAYALMYSAYVQTNIELGRSNTNLPRDRWKFMSVENSITTIGSSKEAEKKLAVSKDLMFKAIKLNMGLKILAGLLILLIIAAAIYAGYKYWNESVVNISVKYIYIAIGIFLLGMLSKLVASVINYKTTIRKNLVKLGVALAGFIVCNLYMWIANPLYNRSGRVKLKGP